MKLYCLVIANPCRPIEPHYFMGPDDYNKADNPNFKLYEIYRREYLDSLLADKRFREVQVEYL